MPEDDELDVRVERRSDAVVVVLRGAVDLRTAPVVEAVLRQETRAACSSVIVDLSATEVLTCRGIGALVAARVVLARAGHPFLVTGAHGTVARLLDVFPEIEQRG